MEERTNQIVEEVKSILIKNHPEIVVCGTPYPDEEVMITVFWNRLSAIMWRDSSSFKFKIDDYDQTLNETIIPFSESNIFKVQ
ncbi:hypothetical protein J8L88_09895 [Aquimarina sp. MMG015]|uniref:hypothetical protein n=1 Tax=Aquimarina sp. MMG015 TaxID=2822689 RepID=UPI001B3A25BC|nr:hypothetical protein [Aquimarina sp. MMG015]MBQ4803160.1 hypothetical protein [Aquimarina sp. MMG015]